MTFNIKGIWLWSPRLNLTAIVGKDDLSIGPKIKTILHVTKAITYKTLSIL
jgi:hypothetical protein